MDGASQLRTIEIRGPSARGEGMRVLGWAAAVLVVSALVIGRSGGSATTPAGLAPYQVRFSELAPAEQRIVRELREGLAEAERVRGEKGAWPTVEALAADGIPPFAADPLAPDLAWTLRRDREIYGYVGESKRGGPAYLIWIQEPEPGVPGDPPNTPADETHHPIAGGMILHVGSYVREASPAPAGISVRPWMDGWKQVVTEVKR